MKTTLKKMLDGLGFDWETGRIVHQPVDAAKAPGWSDPVGAEFIEAGDSILTTEFDNGFGAPQCPRFVAEDASAFYFPMQYDGATQLEKVWKDLGKYLDFEKNPTPYPGG
jgi:hypothetical protein